MGNCRARRIGVPFLLMFQRLVLVSVKYKNYDIILWSWAQRLA